MPGTIFEKLLDSYDGIRRRAWVPTHVIQEVERSPQDITAAYTAATQALNNFVAGGMGSGNLIGTDLTATKQKDDSIYVTNNRGITLKLMGKVGADYTIAGGKEKGKPLSTFAAANVQGQPMARRFILAFAEEGEGAPEDTEKKKGKGKEPSKKDQLEGAEQLAFLPEQRETIQNHFIDVEGLNDEAAKKRVDEIEYAVNNPSTRTPIGRALAEQLGARPDMAHGAKQQMMKIYANAISAAGKIQTVKTKEGPIRVVNVEGKGALTGEELEALSLITIRGQTDPAFSTAKKPKPRVFIGRDGVEIEGYEELQEFVGGYSEDGYGNTWGNLFGDSLNTFWDVRRMTEAEISQSLTDPLDKDGIKALDPATRLSKNMEAGHEGIGNDYKGKLLEDLVQYQAAKMAFQAAKLSGDDAEIEGALALQEEAVELVVNRLQLGATMMAQDLNNLRTTLLDSEFEGLQDLQRLRELGLPPESMLRIAMSEAAAQTEMAFELFGLNKDNILRVERPSLTSRQGVKSDVDIILKPGTKLNPKVVTNGKFKIELSERDVVDPETGEPVVDPETGEPTGEKEQLLRINPKNYSSGTSTCVLGSNSLQSSYAPDPVDPGPTASEQDKKSYEVAKAAQDNARALHNTFLENGGILDGVISDADRQQCTDALEFDRDLRERLENGVINPKTGEREGGIGKLSDANRGDMQSWVQTMQDTPPSFGTDAGRTFYQTQLKKLQGSLKKEGGSLRQAALHIWQLERIRKAQDDPTYAAGIAVNDMVFSTGTFDPETLMRASPGQTPDHPSKLGIGTIHDTVKKMAQQAFDLKNGGAKINMSSCNIVGPPKIGKSGKPLKTRPNLFSTMIRAKTTKGRRKQIGEGRLHHAGAEKCMTFHDVPAVGMPEVEEDETAEGEAVAKKKSNNTDKEEAAVGEALMGLIRKALLTA